MLMDLSLWIESSLVLQQYVLQLQLFGQTQIQTCQEDS